MSQGLLPGYGNVPTMDRMIGHLKQKETKKGKKVEVVLRFSQMGHTMIAPPPLP